MQRNRLWILAILLLAIAIVCARTGFELPAAPAQVEPSRTVVSQPTVTRTGAPTRTFEDTEPAVQSGLPDCLPPNPPVDAQVVEVIDGDTVRVRINEQVYSVRYIGIDAPETAGTVEQLGPEAANANEFLVGGQTVALVKDASETDQYGRLLRYVFADDTFVNRELVREGYAQAISYPPDIACQELLLDAERQARQEGAGLWGLPEPTATTAQGAGTLSGVPWTQAGQYLGEPATVCGPVVGTHYAASTGGSPTFLNIGRDYPDPDRFTVLIWGDDRDRFNIAPEGFYLDKEVCVSGTVELYEGSYEMIISSPSQISIVE